VTAEKAVFSNKEQKITFTGHPRAWEKQNEITGAEMILFLQEDRVVVNGGEQRVRMVLYPEGAEVPNKVQRP
jgi:lipopolysaccharide export system protein LptA